MCRYKYVFLIAFMMLAICTFLAFPPVAQADGGAPNLAYVAGATGGVAIVDVMQQKVSGTIKVTGDPHAVALSLDGRFLYVTQPQLHQVSILAAKTGDVVCTASIPGAPDLLTFDPNVNLLYVAGNQSSTITVVDATNCAIKQHIETAGPVSGMAYAVVGFTTAGKTGEQLWVSNEKSISIYDDVSDKHLGTVAVPQGPRYITIPAGGNAYVTTGQGSVISIDINSHKITSLVSGGSYGPMDFDETTGVVYVPDSANNQVLVLNPVNTGYKIPKEPDRIIKLNASPRSVAITSDGQLGFFALSNGNAVMYDIPGQQISTTIYTGGTPQFIITGVYPPAFGTTPSQANFWVKFANIAGYVVVIVLIIIPIVLFRRHSKARRSAHGAEDEAQAEEAVDSDKVIESRVHSQKLVHRQDQKPLDE
jgi:DNA-binding beta-propeller fold protein YncE